MISEDIYCPRGWSPAGIIIHKLELIIRLFSKTVSEPQTDDGRRSNPLSAIPIFRNIDIPLQHINRFQRRSGFVKMSHIRIRKPVGIFQMGNTAKRRQTIALQLVPHEIYLRERITPIYHILAKRNMNLGFCTEQIDGLDVILLSCLERNVFKLLHTPHRNEMGRGRLIGEGQTVQIIFREIGLLVHAIDVGINHHLS